MVPGAPTGCASLGLHGAVRSLPPGGRGQPQKPSPRGLRMPLRHRRAAAESLMRMLARHALRRLCTGSAARSAWWVWSICLARAPPGRPGSDEARARRTRLSHMDLPAHRRTPRGPRESKEVFAHSMLPYELKVPAACQTRWTPEAGCDLAPLHRWPAGWPPLGNAAASEISGGERSRIRRTAHDGELTVPRAGRG